MISLFLDRAKITTIFDEYEAFVNGYDLSKLHFAITPWSKSYYNENFHRDHDKQYISEASRQDKKVNTENSLIVLVNFNFCLSVVF